MRCFDKRTNKEIEVIKKAKKDGTYFVRRLDNNVVYVIPKEDIGYKMPKKATKQS